MARVRPLAELHVHLEGTVTPEVVCELDPTVTLAEGRAKYHYSDFAGFIQTYIFVNRYLDGPKPYGLILRRLLESYEAQDVVYAEINLSVGMLLWKKQDVEPIFEQLCETAESSSVRVRWIFDA